MHMDVSMEIFLLDFISMDISIIRHSFNFKRENSRRVQKHVWHRQIRAKKCNWTLSFSISRVLKRNEKIIRYFPDSTKVTRFSYAVLYIELIYFIKLHEQKVASSDETQPHSGKIPQIVVLWFIFMALRCWGKLWRGLTHPSQYFFHLIFPRRGKTF